ncbi:MAG: response regulator transcription factor [Aquificaceae bacterium]
MIYVKVLIIEDDKLLGESIRELLRGEGMHVDWVYDPREVLDFLDISLYDVIILDLMMPHISGEMLLGEIRKVDKKTPVLILTAKKSIEDKERCFTSGADDYLTKPFEPKELILRIKSLYRRKVGTPLVIIGNVKVDLEKEELTVSEKPVNLSRKEWLLFKYLVENKGRFVSSEELLNYVWGDEPVGDDVVRTHIRNLRKNLPDGFIVSRKGRGYKIED